MFEFKNPLFLLTIAAMLGCGLMAGVFFAFSTFVMNALECLPPNQGISAMQAINSVVPGSIFGAAFFLTPIVCLLTMIVAFIKWENPAGYYVLTATIIYLITTLLVTIFFNIPLNNLLAEIQTSSPDAGDIWSKYLTDWSLWNHVRTVGAVISTVLFMFGLR